MFGRRQRTDQAEAAKEAERRALFEELAKRPDTVCPFLGLAGSRAEYHQGVTREHRCYAFGEPADLSAEQQEKVCLQRGYGNCPRYLRGVLVIPTEELEALRRPVAALPPPPPKPVKPVKPAPSPAGAGAGNGGRRGLILVGLLLLVIAGGGAAAFLFLGPGPVANQSPSPTPSTTVSASVQASAVPTPSQSLPASPTPEPTPTTGDVFDHYEVAVAPGEAYTLFQVDEGTGDIIGSRPAAFDDWSRAPVERLQRPDGSLYWRTSEGDYTGLSYIHDGTGGEDSGPFQIRRVYLTPAGERRVLLLPEDQI